MKEVKNPKLRILRILHILLSRIARRSKDTSNLNDSVH